MPKPKIIIVPGNGNTDIETANWYAWLRDKLRQQGYPVIAQNMPDPELARKDIWLPHFEKKFGADADTVLIGHSSGGVAALRYLENHKLLGVIVAGVNHTDLGEELEKQSGYYDEPWLWGKIKSNANWIVQFASQDDPYIPITQARHIHEQLSCEYHEYTDRGHFGSEFMEETEFPELLAVIQRKLS